LKNGHLEDKGGYGKNIKVHLRETNFVFLADKNLPENT